jgi:hypothetical protein
MKEIMIFVNHVNIHLWKFYGFPLFYFELEFRSLILLRMHA